MHINTLHIKILTLLAWLCATSCVHEFAEQEMPEAANELVLRLDLPLDTELYREIIYPPSDTRSSRTPGVPSTIHYRIKGWLNADSKGSARALAAITPDLDFDTFGHSPDSPSATLSLGALKPGHWHFVVWADVADDSGVSLSHDATLFDNIEVVHTDGFIANSQLALAWRGETEIDIAADGLQQHSLTLEQPQGLFRFITTDLEEFLDAEAESVRGKPVTNDASMPGRGADISDYRVDYYVTGYYPTTFDNFINKPVDARTGMYGRSIPTANLDGTANLGGLHVLVNGTETAVDVVAVTIFNPTGETVGRTEPVKVPVVRGKLTIVRGKVLTAKAEGGININTDFDGEYNIEIR